MILNINNGKDFCLKYLPSGRIRDDDMAKVWGSIQDYLNSNVGAANALNNTYLSLLDITAKESNDAMANLRTLSSALADLYSISGESKKSFSPFDHGIKITEEGLSANSDLLNISLSKSSTANYIPKDIRVATRTGQLGNSVEYEKLRYADIENIVGSHSRLEIESFNTELSVSINIDLGQSLPLNTVGFTLTNFGVRLPSIESIQTSEDGSAFTTRHIVASNSTSIDLEDFSFPQGRVLLEMEEFSARYIRIAMTQRFSYLLEDGSASRYAIGISELHTAFGSAVDTGSLIIGPLKSESEILKVAISADSQRESVDGKNITFYLSNDLDNWYEITNSRVFSAGAAAPKVINFNNIDESSIETADPVKRLYLKVSMNSIDASYLRKASLVARRSRATLGRSNKRIPISDPTDSIHVYESNLFRYGSSASYPGGSSVRGGLHVSGLRTNGLSRHLSVTPSDTGVYLLGGQMTAPGNAPLAVQSKMDKCHVVEEESIVCELTDDFDPHAAIIHSVSKPIMNGMNIETSRGNSFSVPGGMPVLPFSAEAGVYFLATEEGRIEIDLSEGFAYSNSQLVIEVPEGSDSINLYNEIGRLVSTLTPIRLDDVTYVSIADAIGVTYPAIGNLTYSTSYPIRRLAENEVSVEYGNIAFGGYFKGAAELVPRIMLKRINSRPVYGINTTRLLLESSKKIRASYQLLGYDLERTVKLKHTNIMGGTVRFDISQASVNAFMKEVPFEDGQSEFVLSSSVTGIVPKGVSSFQLRSDYVDSEDVVFAGSTHQFSNRVYSEEELSEEGDWMLETVDHVTSVRLPSDIRTDEVVDAEITYRVRPGRASSSGLYSIDYRRGIIHTSAKVDHRTTVSYSYSHIFAEYESLKELNSEDFSVSPSSVDVLIETGDESEYLAVIIDKNTGELNYSATPVISDLRINIITAEDFM